MRPLLKIGVSGEFKNLGMSFGSTIRAPKPAIFPFSSRMGIMMFGCGIYRTFFGAPVFRLTFVFTNSEQASIDELLLVVTLGRKVLSRLSYPCGA